MFFEIGQEHPAHRERAVSAGEPHRRKPGISAADAGIRDARAQAAGGARGRQQFHFADRVVRGGYAHPVVFGISLPVVQVGGGRGAERDQRDPTPVGVFLLMCVGVQILWNAVSALVRTLHV